MDFDIPSSRKKDLESRGGISTCVLSCSSEFLCGLVKKIWSGKFTGLRDIGERVNCSNGICSLGMLAPISAETPIVDAALFNQLLVQLSGIHILGFILLGALLYALISYVTRRLMKGSVKEDSVTAINKLTESMEGLLKKEDLNSRLDVDEDSDFCKVGEMYNTLLDKAEKLFMEQEELLNKLENSNQHLEVQKNIIHDIYETSSLEEALVKILPSLIKVSGYQGIRVSKINAEGQVKFLSSSWDVGKQVLVNPEFLDQGTDRGWNVSLIEEHGYEKLEAVPYTQVEGTEALSQVHLNSALILPVKIKEELVAVLEIFSEKKTPLDLKKKQLEETLMRSLSERIEKDKQQAVLQKALNASVDSNRSQAEFLAMMSHEIRTPMNGVLGSANLLKISDVNPSQRDLTDSISSSAESLLVIINDILDFSKYRADTFQLHPHDFSLKSITDSILNDMKTRYDHEKLSLNVQIDPKLPKILNGDGARLRQIMLNLVNNAVKFTSEGSVTLDLQLIEFSEEKVKFKCSVIDTGIGIPKDVIPSLFNSFKQVDGTSTRKYGGTGLGLAICKQLVEKMGGKISVDSQEGEGTTFTFVVELSSATESDVAFLEDDEWPDTSMGRPTSGSLTGPAVIQRNTKFGERYPGSVLLVDDNLINRKLAKGFLEGWGYFPDIACDGKEAVAAATDKVYNLILMDVQMPVMDGIEATRQIRKLPSPHSDGVIIANTAAVMPGDKQRCVEAGMDGYLPKPLESKSVFRTFLKFRNVLFKELKKTAENEATEGTKKISLGFDPSLPKLNTLLKNDAAMIREFIPPFVSEIKEHLELDLDEICDDNIEEIQRIFHSLKTNALVFGSENFSKFCTELEAHAKQHNFSEIKKNQSAFKFLIKEHVKSLEGVLSTL